MKIISILIPLLFLLSCSTSRLQQKTEYHRAPSAFDKKLSLTRYLDEQNHIWLSSIFDPEVGTFRMTLLHQSEGLNTFELPLPIIKEGLTVEVNNKKVYGAIREVHAGIQDFEVFVFEGKFPVSQDSVIKYKLYDKLIAEYIFDPKFKRFIPTMKERMLSAFDMRQFYLQGATYVKQWKKRGVTIAQGEAATNLDLHTHYGGAMRAETILEIADELHLEYPIDLLKKYNVFFNPSKVYEKDGIEYVNLKKPNYDYRKFSSLMSINVEGSISFEQMEEIYQLRGPLVKNQRAFKRFLEEIAKDYSKMGVHYAELSISDIVKPEWLQDAKEIIPQIKEKTGVDLRFLVGLWRHSDEEYNLQMVNKIEDLKDEKLIVGIDIMGMESNPTRDQKATIQSMAEFKRTTRPDFQIRVHAGENAMNLENVKEAIKLGATRVGHGIYGIDDETIALAKQHNVLIEINANSNLALQNIETQNTLPLKKYLQNGVRITLGTDGHGLYNTSSQAELAVIKSLGFTEQDIDLIRRSDDEYLNSMRISAKNVSSDCIGLLMQFPIR